MDEEECSHADVKACPCAPSFTYSHAPCQRDKTGRIRVEHTHFVSLTHTRQTHEAPLDPPCSAGSSAERAGGGVEVRTDQFGWDKSCSSSRHEALQLDAAQTVWTRCHLQTNLRAQQTEPLMSLYHRGNECACSR